MAEALAALVNERSQGGWQIHLHYGEALSKARENLDGLAINAFEGAMVCNFYHPRKNPALMVLTMPFLPMTSWENNRRVRETVYQHPAVVEELARWNAMAYTSSFLPQYEFMGRGAPPLTLEDWHGKTVRAGGGLGEAMLKLGATPTSSTATEVYTGVQQGTMDAAAFPFTYSHISYRIHEVSDWYTSNLAPGTADCVLAFSKSAYGRLSDHQQQLLADIKDEVIDRQINAYREVDAVNVPMLKNSLIEVIYTPEQRLALQAIAGRPVIEEWIGRNQSNFDARGLVESIYSSVGQSYD